MRDTIDGIDEKGWERAMAGVTVNRYQDRIESSGMGGYLDPPLYPTHTHSVSSGPKSNPHSLSSLPAAIKADYINPKVRAEAARLLQHWADNRPKLTSPEVQAWIADCQRHWYSCWYSETPDTNGCHAASLHSRHTQPKPTNAIDYATYHIQRFYPEWIGTREARSL